jgi:hypothetical protein
MPGPASGSIPRAVVGLSILAAAEPTSEAHCSPIHPWAVAEWMGWPLMSWLRARNLGRWSTIYVSHLVRALRLGRSATSCNPVWLFSRWMEPMTVADVCVLVCCTVQYRRGTNRRLLTGPDLIGSSHLVMKFLCPGCTDCHGPGLCSRLSSGIHPTILAPLETGKIVSWGGGGSRNCSTIPGLCNDDRCAEKLRYSMYSTVNCNKRPLFYSTYSTVQYWTERKN